MELGDQRRHRAERGRGGEEAERGEQDDRGRPRAHLRAEGQHHPQRPPREHATGNQRGADEARRTEPGGEATADELPRVKTRVALFRAEHGLVTADIGREMYELLGRVAPVIEIPEAYHHIMLDQPLSLVTGLRTLLADRWTARTDRGAEERLAVTDNGLSEPALERVADDQ